MKLDIHPIQAKILLALLYSPTAKFSELNSDKISSDLFSFHLNHLIEKQLIEKNQTQYILSNKGKKYANTLSQDNLELHEQGKVAVLVICERLNGKAKEYLIQKRSKQPYRDSFAFIAGKIGKGEKVASAAKRQLQEETHLSASMSLLGIIHKLDTDITNVLLEDKYYFVFVARNYTGKLLEVSPDGTHSWMSLSQIKKLRPTVSGTSEAIALLEKNTFSFIEKVFRISDF